MGKIFENFKKKLLEAGVDVASNKMTLDFEDTFLKAAEFKKENPYEKYNWIVMPHSAEGLAGGILIHAVPPLEEHHNLPWEEWYVQNGVPHHTVLYTKKQRKVDGEFSSSLDDTDHPKEVLGKKWYFQFEKSLTPLLFQ